MRSFICLMFFIFCAASCQTGSNAPNADGGADQHLARPGKPSNAAFCAGDSSKPLRCIGDSDPGHAACFDGRGFLCAGTLAFGCGSQMWTCDNPQMFELASCCDNGKGEFTLGICPDRKWRCPTTGECIAWTEDMITFKKDVCPGAYTCHYMTQSCLPTP